MNIIGRALAVPDPVVINDWKSTAQTDNRVRPIRPGAQSLGEI